MSIVEQAQVVIVEDNRADLNLIKRSIREAGVGCEVTSFADGAEAIAFINRADAPVANLVVLDLNLPAVEGATVLNSLRGSPRWSHVPVLVFTSSTAAADISRIQKLGADAYITKPSQLEEFIKIGHQIKEWLQKGSVSTTTASQG